MEPLLSPITLFYFWHKILRALATLMPFEAMSYLASSAYLSHCINITSDQSYKRSTIVNYNSRVILVSATLCRVISYDCSAFIRLATGLHTVFDSPEKITRSPIYRHQMIWQRALRVKLIWWKTVGIMTVEYSGKANWLFVFGIKSSVANLIKPLRS